MLIFNIGIIYEMLIAMINRLCGPSNRSFGVKSEAGIGE